jgi:DNA-binding MarR family transcriptional regulator
MTDLTEPVETADKPRAKTPRAKTPRPRGNGRAARKRNLPEAKLLEFAELLFFAYRDFTRDPDAILKDFGFGRAHHRVLHFVNRHSGLRVADLLDILTITKQSLSRVLGQLVRDGFVTQTQGPTDRRQRLLNLTPKGEELERRLSENQRALIARAYREAGAEAVEGFRKVLLGMIEERDRAKFERSGFPGQAAIRRPG